MSTSVLVQTLPGGSPHYVIQTASATDSVGVSKSINSFCGNRNYSIISVSAFGVDALSTSELTIDPGTGLISVYTDNNAAVGTHTATVTAKLASFLSIPAVTTTF